MTRKPSNPDRRLSLRESTRPFAERKATFTRLIVEAEPNAGAWNMALDEALLHSAIDEKIRTVRLYRWSEPTVSLGYFQKPEEINPTLAGLAAVRRLTGGGAILHHHEWTYSCCVPAGDPAIRVPGELYGAVHRAIIGVLREFAVTSFVRSDESPMSPPLAKGGPGEVGTNVVTGEPPPGPPPLLRGGNESSFLCFSRGDPNDVVLDGLKIVGSAQRRRKGAVLQHGSLLLRASEHAPHLPGIADLHPGFDPPPSLGEQLGRAIAVVFGGDVKEWTTSAEELELAKRFQQERYEEFFGKR